jgi:hypothetical protein
MSDRRNGDGPCSAPIEGNDLDARLRTLEHRLDDGFRRINQAALGGSDVTEWESFWIRLLGEYEGVCRELDVAA